jgi:cardiolipin synthase A/B
MHRYLLNAVAGAALLTAVVGCGARAAGQATVPAARPPMATSTAKAPVAAFYSAIPARTATTMAARAGRLQVLVEPAAGIEPIYRLITGARRAVDLTMYELSDATAEADLAADAARGVDVRVLLDQHLERSRNMAAYDYLASHGVHVRWAASGTTYHQKTLTVDDSTAVIMTLNLVTDDYPDTRDFAVIDTKPADIAAIVTTFNADYAGRAITPPEGSDLVWSPTNSLASVLAVISGARHTLAIEDEEMDDPEVTSALEAAARHGVDVKIIMTADPEWDAAFNQLVAAGVHVRLMPDDSSALYIHAKVIVADAGRPGQRMLIGSQNFSVASLDYNRELGVLVTDPALIKTVNDVLLTDYQVGSPYRQPKRAGAWCRATATVYNAAADENNVYVHSNQPDTEATASADGYSHSYPTDGSGYALIYLNGPPPGALITVHVGGATCAARD